MKEKGKKLLEEDENPHPRFERLICCHVLEMDEGSSDEEDESRSIFKQSEKDLKQKKQLSKKTIRDISPI